MKQKTEAADYRAVTLRLPEGLLETIRLQAAEGRRPLNTQIIMLLEKALRLPRRPAPGLASAE